MFGEEAMMTGYLKFPFVVISSTIIWLIVTFMTQPEENNILYAFYKKTQPGGPGWRKILDDAQEEKVNIKVPNEKWSVPNGVLAMILGCVAIYSCMFGIGNLIYGNYQLAAILILVMIVFAFLLKRIWSKIKGNIL